MTATSVAFFRNLNVGQRRSPSRDQLLDAFAAAGATDVLSHLSNGTVAFTAAGDPQPLADAVAERLSTVCDYADLAVVRPVAWLVDLDLDALPDGCELTLFDGPSPFPEAAVGPGPRRRHGAGRRPPPRDRPEPRGAPQQRHSRHRVAARGPGHVSRCRDRPAPARPRRPPLIVGDTPGMHVESLGDSRARAAGSSCPPAS
ncbi:DUF1697 domain-containing protein [Nocardioides sp. G10]|uniref:DUF1697 domain-containing protein n=1 Tax=Nocardioides baculatus TaxID=2801337 RepID=A0ABS1LD93_9ACTN|nr:DUF1697 domain-containing protein [Nocardioides baculatus]